MPPGTGPAGAGPEAPDGRKRILLIDDDAAFVAVLKDGLESLGYKTAVAFDSLQGLLQAHNFQPDLILLDFHMPAGGGPTAYERLRAAPDTAAVPVVFTTAARVEEVKGSIRPGPRTYFLKKPVTLAHVKTVLDKVLAPPGGASPLEDGPHAAAPSGAAPARKDAPRVFPGTPDAGGIAPTVPPPGGAGPVAAPSVPPVDPGSFGAASEAMPSPRPLPPFDLPEIRARGGASPELRREETSVHLGDAPQAAPTASSEPPAPAAPAIPEARPGRPPSGLDPARGPLPNDVFPSRTRVHEFETRVIYGDTDKMGVIYYANYFKYFEQGRTEWVRAIGLRYRDLELQRRLFLPVTEAHCAYRGPSRYDDLLRVRTWLARLGPASITFRYEIVVVEPASGAGGANRLVAAGYTRHAVVDDRWKPLRIPADLAALLRPFASPE